MTPYDASFEQDAPVKIERGKPCFVMVPLSMAPYPAAFLEAINGFATGGSTRCLEAIHEEGAWILPTPPKVTT